MEKLLKLINDIDNIKTHFHKVGGGGMPECNVIYDVQEFQDWIQSMIFELRKISNPDEYIEETLQLLMQEFGGWKDEQEFKKIKSKLSVIRENITTYSSSVDNDEAGEKNKMSRKVFIVHGHDNESKITVARTLEKASVDAIILHEQPNLGKTIMEKLAHFTDVDYAIVLYTECDKGRAKEDKVEDEKFRARQNVVFEHGYLIGKLGRDKVFALVKGDVETPGDISGVVYTPMDDRGAWKMDLARDMKAAGLEIDINAWI